MDGTNNERVYMRIRMETVFHPRNNNNNSSSSSNYSNINNSFGQEQGQGHEHGRITELNDNDLQQDIMNMNTNMNTNTNTNTNNGELTTSSRELANTNTDEGLGKEKVAQNLNSIAEGANELANNLEIMQKHIIKHHNAAIRNRNQDDPYHWEPILLASGKRLQNCPKSYNELLELQEESLDPLLEQLDLPLTGNKDDKQFRLFEELCF